MKMLTTLLAAVLCAALVIGCGNASNENSTGTGGASSSGGMSAGNATG